MNNIKLADESSLKMANLFLILLGSVMGIWMFLSRGTLIILLLSFSLLYLLRYFVPERDRPFIYKIAALGFILRILVILLYYYLYLGHGFFDFIGPDGEVYSQRGWYLSRVIFHHNPFDIPRAGDYIFKNYAKFVVREEGKLLPMNAYQVGLYSYWMAFLYSVFGYSTFLMRFLNSFLSIWTGIIVYFIGKEVFTPKMGKLAMAIFIFIPSVFVFSITLLRDNLVLFLAVVIIWSLMKFLKERRLLWLILAAAADVLILQLRIPLFYVFALTISISLLFYWRASFLIKLITVVLVTVMFLITPANKIARHVFDLHKLFHIHYGYVKSPGNNYTILPQYIYSRLSLGRLNAQEIAVGFANGLYHVLFEPVPANVTNGFSFFAFLQNVLFLLCFPFIALGVLIGIRYRWKQSLPIVFYLVISLLLMAASEGNVGTLVRHRDAIMPFLAIWAAAGFCAIFQKGRSILKAE